MTSGTNRAPKVTSKETDWQTVVDAASPKKHVPQPGYEFGDRVFKDDVEENGTYPQAGQDIPP